MSDFYSSNIESDQDEIDQKLDLLIDHDTATEHEQLQESLSKPLLQQNVTASPSASSLGQSSVSSSGVAGLSRSNPNIAEPSSTNPSSNIDPAVSNSNKLMFDPSANPYYPSSVANANQFQDIGTGFPSNLSANDTYAALLAQQQQAAALSANPNQLDFSNLSLSSNPQLAAYLGSSNYANISAQIAAANPDLTQGSSIGAAPAATSTLFVGDISVYCVEDDLLDLFRRFGTILAASFKRTTNKSAPNMTTINTLYGASANIVQGNLRYGFIRYQTTEEAQMAMKELNGFILKGRALRVGWGQGAGPSEPGPVASLPGIVPGASTPSLSLASANGNSVAIPPAPGLTAPASAASDLPQGPTSATVPAPPGLAAAAAPSTAPPVSSTLNPNAPSVYPGQFALSSASATNASSITSAPPSYLTSPALSATTSNSIYSTPVSNQHSVVAPTLASMGIHGLPGSILGGHSHIHGHGHAGHGGEVHTAQVHISFISKQVQKVVSEETIRGLFERFGHIIDIVLKKVEFDKVLEVQHGYGFVHFPLNDEGITAALQAVKELDDSYLDGVSYNCKLSKSLEKYLSTHAAQHASVLAAASAQGQLKGIPPSVLSGAAGLSASSRGVGGMGLAGANLTSALTSPATLSEVFDPLGAAQRGTGSVGLHGATTSSYNITPPASVLARQQQHQYQPAHQVSHSALGHQSLLAGHHQPQHHPHSVIQSNSTPSYPYGLSTAPSYPPTLPLASSGLHGLPGREAHTPYGVSPSVIAASHGHHSHAGLGIGAAHGLGTQGLGLGAHAGVGHSSYSTLGGLGLGAAASRIQAQPSAYERALTAGRVPQPLHGQGLTPAQQQQLDAYYASTAATNSTYAHSDPRLFY